MPLGFTFQTPSFRFYITWNIKEDLKELSDILGILDIEMVEEITTFFRIRHHGYKKYSINPNYRDALAKITSEMNAKEKFNLFPLSG